MNTPRTFALIGLASVLGSPIALAITPAFYTYHDAAGTAYAVSISEEIYRANQPVAIEVKVRSCTGSQVADEVLSQTADGVREAWAGNSIHIELGQGYELRHGGDRFVLMGPSYTRPC